MLSVSSKNNAAWFPKNSLPAGGNLYHTEQRKNMTGKPREINAASLSYQTDLAGETHYTAETHLFEIKKQPSNFHLVVMLVFTVHSELAIISRLDLISTHVFQLTPKQNFSTDKSKKTLILTWLIPFTKIHPM